VIPGSLLLVGTVNRGEKGCLGAAVACWVMTHTRREGRWSSATIGASRRGGRTFLCCCCLLDVDAHEGKRATEPADVGASGGEISCAVVA